VTAPALGNEGRARFGRCIEPTLGRWNCGVCGRACGIWGRACGIAGRVCGICGLACGIAGRAWGICGRAAWAGRAIGAA